MQVLVGPAGSGKTHLAHVWRLASGASLVTAEDLARADLDDVCAHPALVLEDADRFAGGEDTLFHFINLCRERKVDLLMTARALPRDWPFSLPDLVSRLRSFPVVMIGSADDDLLRAVLVKHFQDRQLNVPPHVITYLAARMERSMDAARAIAEALDRKSLERGRPITRQLAAEVLEQPGAKA
ncbi:MAG: chromosomal replication initiator DnaA [Alphaproteobacteria bacterium]|nr:MAG: chromosomal replication initiator DnaA [Alphaproteobacteria bacterium]